jgi:hypothetical protein
MALQALSRGLRQSSRPFRPPCLRKMAKVIMPGIDILHMDAGGHCRWDTNDR